MWARFSARCSKKKVLNGEHLLHSEWNRRLGAFSLAGIGGVFSLAVTLFILLPGIFSSGSVVPPFPSVFIGVFANFFFAKQLSAIARILPSNCLLYELAYATHSEFLAFIFGWSQMADSLCFISIIARSLADHIRLLFTSAIQTNFNGNQLSHAMEVNSDQMPLVSFDAIALVAIVLSALILCCSLRVLATISIVFLISSLFTVTSTTVVAILHNVQQLRITSLGLPYEFSQISAEMHWILMGIFCIEAFSHVSEETEQPRKILPRFFPLLSKLTSGLLVVAMIAFFPFTQRLHFHDKILLPNVFNSISIYSARYLLSVGAVCALTGALLCSFLPASRVICSMTKDGLLPFPNGINEIHGKGGAPRFAVIISALFALVLTIFPKNVLLLFLPIDICTRIFCQSLLLYQASFSSDKIGLSKVAPKYNRLKTTAPGKELTDSALEGYSCISSSDEADPDDEIISHLCELHNQQNVKKWSAVLDSASEAGYQNYVEIGSTSSQAQRQTCPNHQHNCFEDSCGELLLNSEDKHGFAQYHVYEAELENSPFSARRSDGQQKEPFSNPEVAMKKAMKYLTYFVVSSVFSALSYKSIREVPEFTPILPFLVLVASLISTGIFLALAFKLRSSAEDHQTPICLPILSLILIFVTCQTFFTFQLIQYFCLFLCAIVGIILYTFSICRQFEF